MNRIKYNHIINSQMRNIYGRRWKKIKKFLKNLTVIKISDQIKIGEENTAYLLYKMTKPGTIVELSDNKQISFLAPNIINTLYN